MHSQKILPQSFVSSNFGLPIDTRNAWSFSFPTEIINLLLFGTVVPLHSPLAAPLSVVSVKLNCLLLLSSQTLNLLITLLSFIVLLAYTILLVL